MVGVRLAEGAELVRRARILEAAPGVHVGQNDDLLRAEDLGGIGHELDPAEGDDLGVGLGRLAAQLEAVADEIGEVLQFGLLVVVRQDDGVALLAQAVDLGAQVRAGGVLRFDAHDLSNLSAGQMAPRASQIKVQSCRQIVLSSHWSNQTPRLTRLTCEQVLGDIDGPLSVAQRFAQD